MLENTLRELGDQGYEIEWKYERITNSIIIRMRKSIPGKEWQRYQLCQRIDFYIARHSICLSTNFNIVMSQILKEMAERLERYLKGENTNAEN